MIDLKRLRLLKLTDELDVAMGFDYLLENGREDVVEVVKAFGVKFDVAVLIAELIRGLDLEEDHSFDYLIETQYTHRHGQFASRWTRRDSLHLINCLIGGHGIQTLNRAYTALRIAQYINTGDAYRPTVVWDLTENRFVLASWAEWLEAFEERDKWNGMATVQCRNCGETTLAVETTCKACGSRDFN